MTDHRPTQYAAGLFDGSCSILRPVAIQNSRSGWQRRKVPLPGYTFTHWIIRLIQGNEYGASRAPEVFFRISILGAMMRQFYCVWSESPIDRRGCQDCPRARQ